MKKILYVQYLLGPVSERNNSLCQMFSILETIEDVEKIIFLSTNKSDTDLNKILRLSKFNYSGVILEHLSLHQCFLDNLQSTSNWTELINNTLNLINLDKYCNTHEIYYITFGGVLSDSYRTLKRLTTVLDKKTSYAHETARLLLFKGLIKLFIIKHGVKCKHIIFDPYELNYSKYPNYERFFGYSDNSKNIKRLDTLQYYLLEKEREVEKLNYSKKIDLSFGIYLDSKDREYLIEPFMNIKKLGFSSKFRIKTFEKIKKLKVNNSVNRPTYLQFIKDSKFTIVFRSVEPQSFSIFRFIESLYYDCIPLLWVDSNYELLESYGIDTSFLKEKIVVFDKTSILEKLNYSNESRKEILFYLKQKIFNNNQLEFI